MRGLPFYGKGDFNFVASRSNFSNGISISVLPLSDLSRPQDVAVDEFDQELKALNNAFKTCFSLVSSPRQPAGAISRITISISSAR